MNLIEGLNIEYFHMEPDQKADRFEAKMNLTSFHSQPFGLLHGGATIAFGETVAGQGSNAILDKDHVAVGSNVVTYHFRPKKIEGYILAKGILMHKGRTSHVWQIEMYDENDRLISCVNVTNTIVDK
ncbi:PaaI family thioesterase [Desulfitobacterium metallireducens]|uniref:Phenylacetic acid degradation protein n=1 Tax=Desulfitobacterium metallireducens DSM 15288 TaxID=871968 RepID=W0EAW2_9FIRM|nr:PaaI family thioesterase [Desulfitobacterium metallireducens]AHF07907.1 phenylacetic acid degradation protein [Desulfitobacterium metallireducens DSM 15288]